MKTITLAHSELTGTIYAIIGKEKVDITNQAIAEVEAIKALEPKLGHWEDCSNGWMCSECGRDNREDTKYCPNCGAKMESEE